VPKHASDYERQGERSVSHHQEQGQIRVLLAKRTGFNSSACPDNWSPHHIASRNHEVGGKVSGSWWLLWHLAKLLIRFCFDPEQLGRECQPDS